MRSGERHLTDRKLLAPSFNGARMRAYGRIMQGATLRELERRRQGAELRAQEAGQAISLDVILEAAFGVSDPGRKAKFRDAILALMRPSDGILTAGLGDEPDVLGETGRRGLADPGIR